MIAMLPAAPCSAPAILRQMRAALGGGLWARVRQTTALGNATVSGLRGVARFDDDLTGGRYARRFRIAVMGASAEIFDGSTVWAQDISGGVHALDAPFPRMRAVTSAYLTSRTYLRPGSYANVRCISSGPRASVLAIRPKGGITATLTIDARTHLLESVAERLPRTTSLTRYADYRQVGDVVLPFDIEAGTIAEPTDDFAFRVRSYRIASRTSGAYFARPAERGPARMLDGARSTTVPLSIEGRQLVVWAALDDHAPMPFILDTGGHAILTTGAAKALGLHAFGAGESGGSGSGTIALQFTRVADVRIGQAKLTDQPFLVIPYPYSFYERGPRTPLAGILGLEIFERFAARIDYAGSRLTLTPLSFAAPAAGTPVPLHFQDDMPLAEAAADGNTGLFGIDTGNAGPVILFGDFLARTGLLEAYRGGTTVRGSGTGGTNTGRLFSLRQFQLSGHSLANVPVDFTRMKSGSFSSWTEAGNIGYEILRHFVPTFDYRREQLTLEAGRRYVPETKNRAGMSFEKNGPEAFYVYLVRPESPAGRAGMRAGDRIVEVDGTPAKRLSRADLTDLISRAPGHALHLSVRRGHVTRSVTFILR